MSPAHSAMQELIVKIEKSAWIDYLTWFYQEREESNGPVDLLHKPNRTLNRVSQVYRSTAARGFESLRPGFDEVVNAQLKEPFTYRLAFERQYFLFLKKLRGGASRSVKEQSVTDAVARLIQVPVKEFANTSKLQTISHRLLGSPPALADLICSHGSGAVSEKIPTHRKVLTQFPSGIAKALFGHRYAIHSEFAPHVTSSRITAVEKDIFKARVIACEAASLQFMQQGLMKHLYRILERGTRFTINFTRQDIHREFMRNGARKLCTVDLSDASDHVKLKHVEAIFPRNWVRLLKRMTSQRITYRDGSGEHLTPVGTFAPMGSSLCFPIMAVVIYTIVRSLGLNDGEFAVYGDDLIVPDYAFNIVCAALVNYGLVVSPKKSFGPETHFRETCGLDLWYDVNGFPHDVTAVYLRDLPWTVDFLFSGPVTIRELIARGFHALADTLVAIMVQHAPQRVLSMAMCGDHPRLFPQVYASLLGLAPQRWNRDLQQCETLLVADLTIPTGKNMADNHLLSMWLHQRRSAHQVTDYIDQFLAVAPFTKGDAGGRRLERVGCQWIVAD